MTRTIFHLDLDTFFVFVERVMNPDLIGQPVIVSPGSARSVVAAASYEARKFGVRSAMPYALAHRLCPQAIVVPGHYRAYQKASDEFFAILDNYSPNLESMSLDEAYLDYTGCEGLFGPPVPAARAIQQRVRRELGLDVSIGISSSKTVSKIASDLAKPAGILYVLPEREAAFLAPLPVGRMPGVGPKSETRLRAAGIHKIGDLVQVPPAILDQTYGDAGTWLIDRARGEDHAPVHSREPAKSISNEETLMTNIADPDRLQTILYRLVCEVGYRLRKASLKARTACVKIRFPDFSLHTQSRTLPDPTGTDRILFAAAKELLAKATARRAALRLVGFAAQNLIASGEQLDLLNAKKQRCLDGLHSAADQVRKRYGYGTIAWARLLTHPDQPEGGRPSAGHTPTSQAEHAAIYPSAPGKITHR